MNSVTETPFFGAAPGVALWQIALAMVAGAVVGYLSGLVAVRIERFEKLEEEEAEDRAEYERDNAESLRKAKEVGDDEPEFPAWEAEHYGSTWLERILSPALGAALFGVFTMHQGVNRLLLLHLLWVSVFIHIVAFDLKHRLILNVITYPSVVAALALAALTPGLGLLPALYGAAVCAVFFLVFSLMTRGGIGLGDAKLGGVIGAVTGFDLGTAQFGAVYALVYGVFLGGATAFVLLVTRVRGLKDPIPYGPFLCAGAALILYISI